LICDQYDTLVSKRAYKKAFSHHEAYRILTVGDEKTKPFHFDPAVLQAFKDKADIFKEIYLSNAD
jgi:putative two-component system response regulator